MAERDVHAIFASLPVHGPVIPDEMGGEADLVHRLTWWDACDHMGDDEKIEACCANSDAMDGYALALAERAAAERWERAPGGPAGRLPAGGNSCRRRAAGRGALPGPERTKRARRRCAAWTLTQDWWSNATARMP